MPSYNGGVVVVLRTEDLAYGQAVEDVDFFTSIIESFNKTFVREQRWKLILSGLGVTILISLCSLVIGTVVGFGICTLRRSKNKFISTVTACVIRFIQGIPLVVLLMVLYYVVFATADISGIIVAIIGFALNFGVYSSEMMRSGIDAVDKGQWEAASALGFGKAKTFQKIVMPQAARHFLPAFKGEFINMMKMTSVVGYIAVQDLTKASDIIRGRTYEAFFPLIAVALIYFLLAWLGKDEQAETLSYLFDLIYFLRNQIFHGSSTYCGKTNREQIQCSCNILEKVLPIIVNIVYNNESVDWGASPYPVVNGKIVSESR